MKRVFLRRVDGSKKNNTNARICLPEKFNEPLIIGRKNGKKRDDGGKEDSSVVAGGKNATTTTTTTTTKTTTTELMFVGLENEPLLEEEHVEVTKRCLRSDGNESVAVQVKPIGKAPVYIQTDSKNLKQLKRNQSVFLLKGQTMFLRYLDRTKGFAVAFVVEEEEEEGNEKPIEVLEIEDSDGGSAEKNAKEEDDDDEVAKGEEDEVEIVEKEEEENDDEEEARKRVLLKKKKKKKISRTKESLVSSSSDDEFVGQGENTFVVEDDDDDDDDDDIDDKNDEGNGSHGNEGRPIPRKKIVLGSSSSSSSSSGSGDSRSRRLSSSESQEDGVEVGDLLTSEEEVVEEEEEEEEEPSARPSGPSLLNLIHKKLKKETFKARSVASKKAAKTVKKRRVRDANGDDNHDDESYDTAPEDGEDNDGNIEDGDIIAKIKRKKAVQKSNPNKKMKPVPSSPIVIGSSDDDDDDADIDAYDFEERATMKNKKKRSTAEVVETEDLENEHQHGKRKKVSDTPPNEWKNVMAARKATTISSMPGAAGARNKRSEAELLEKSSRETEIIAKRLEEQIQRQKREMELERQVREQQRLDELEEQRAREARIRRQQQQQQQEQQQQQQQQHPPYTGEYQDDMSVVTSYAQMLDASAKLKYFEANELREATRRYEEASKQYSKKTYQSAKGPAYLTLQQMKTNLQTTSFKHAQLKMEYSESSRAHKLAIKRAAATAAAAAATTQSTNYQQQTSARKRREAAAATAAEESQDEKQWIEEKSAWDACFVAENDVDESIDPHRDTISGWSIRELKQRGALIGADFSSAIEKSEYIDAIIRRITAVGGKTGWLRLKRQKDASIETKKRQREKLKAYQESTAIDIEAESTTRLLQNQAHRTVEQWSHRADLRLFLVRCGVAVEGGERGRSDKQTLQKAYKRAMLKFHPDRQRTKTERDRVLAAEVTKFITQAWAQLK